MAAVSMEHLERSAALLQRISTSLESDDLSVTEAILQEALTNSPHDEVGIALFTDPSPPPIWACDGIQLRCFSQYLIDLAAHVQFIKLKDELSNLREEYRACKAEEVATDAQAPDSDSYIERLAERLYPDLEPLVATSAPSSSG